MEVEIEWRSGGFEPRSGGLVESGGCVELEVLEVEQRSGGLVGSGGSVNWKFCRLSGGVEG